MNKTELYKHHLKNADLGAKMILSGVAMTGMGIMAELKPVAKTAAIVGGLVMTGFGGVAMYQSTEECARIYAEMDAIEKMSTKVDIMFDEYMSK